MTKITGGPKPSLIAEPVVTGPSAPVKTETPSTAPRAASDGFEVSAEPRSTGAVDGGPKHTSAELKTLLEEITAKDLGDAPRIAPAGAYELTLPKVLSTHAFALPLPAEDLLALRGLKAQLGAISDPSLQRALSDVCDLTEVP